MFDLFYYDSMRAKKNCQTISMVHQQPIKMMILLQKNAIELDEKFWNSAFGGPFRLRLYPNRKKPPSQ